MISGTSDRGKIYGRWFLITLLGLAGIRLFMIHLADLFADESLYHFLALHAPLNFCPHPPGVPFLSRLGTLLLGRTEMGARLMSYVLATLTLFPVYRLAFDIGGRTAAIWSVIALATTPIFVMVGIICTPDGPQLFCYALALMLTWRGMASGRPLWWALAGLVVGVALYIKYIIILYFPALLVCLLATPAGRQHLRTPGPYIAALIAFMTFVPFFLWEEWTSNWAAVRYHLGNRQKFEAPSFENVAVYQLVHIGYYSPLLYGLYLYAMAKLGKRALKTGDAKAAFLASFSAVPWLLFAMIAVITKRELSREQWDAPAYIPALIGAGLLFSEVAKRTDLRGRKWQKLFVAAPFIGAFFILVIAIEGATGSLSGMLNKRLLFTNLVGWQEMAQKADLYIAELPGGTEKIVIGDSFAPALEYAFYSEQPARVFSIFSRRNEKYGLEQVLATSGASQYNLEKFIGSNAIFIFEERAKNPNNSERKNRVQELNVMFKSVTELPQLDVKRWDRPVRIFRFYKCLGLQEVYPKGKPALK